MHSEVMDVAANKFGDISRIHELSPMDISAVSSQRRRCYNQKCKELKKELEAWIIAEEDKHTDADEDDYMLDASILKHELNDCLEKYHGGYDFFAGAHCQPIVDNFGRKYMHLIKDMSQIKRIVIGHVDNVRKRKLEIKNMSES